MPRPNLTVGPSGPRRRRAASAALGAILATVLLAACSGTAIPQAEGSKAVLPGDHGDAPQSPGAPPTVTLATGHARSSAGVIASGGPAAPYNYAPSVLETNGAYRMWWCSQLPGAARPGDQILYATATSPNGPFTAPNGHPGQAVFTNSPNGFDRLHTCDPSVIDVNGVYYLYYTGTFDPHGDRNAIGLATSTDGVHWTRANGGAPIVSAAGDVTHANIYGAGQPSALYLNGMFYLMFTDTTGAATAQNGAGQFVLRSPDPAFRRGVQALGPQGFASVISATGVRTRSVADATTSDWMWVDALQAFAIASDTNGGTTITFWDAGFTGHPYQPITIPGPQREGPGLVRTADGHAPVDPADPCGLVPLDVVRATGVAAGPDGLQHFGVDVDGLHACRTRSAALALLDGFAVPAPDRTVDIVVGDHLVEVERRTVALALAAGMVDTPPTAVTSLPVEAHLRPGAAAVSATGRPVGFRLDDGKLWVVGSAAVAQLNSSPVQTISAQTWDSYPRGTDLSGLRP
ncbi:MAG TPA: beta-xylosidase [Pseudonocardiaceae bacterium]|nr:beta-xylosidase [Pseudonocardiaceae bacterium]